MKRQGWIVLSSLIVVTGLMGCGGKGTEKQGGGPAAPPNAGDVEAKVQTNLSGLSADDRKLAEEQRFCPIMPDERLGGMGVPIKLTLKDKTVFVCCKRCKKRAEDDPEGTLAKLKELKSKPAAQ